jgi:hypothetical protein
MQKSYAVVVFPPRPSAGVSGICIPAEHSNEIARLEAERKVRLWTVRAVISDHVPLYGELDDAIMSDATNVLSTS